ncbi:hypothetical protein U1R68_13550 [Pectobacterium colocasium]|uniref:hypothetical protein n=1 Tax=Pectobacterium colocasium TaxID=2878098 RepID=UPI001CD36399|nr:hypothetical protein [Pectobacterium colocasium]
MSEKIENKTIKDKKIKILLTGEIDLKDIIGETSLTEKENQEMECKKYTKISIFHEFGLPLTLIFFLFLASLFFERKPYDVIVLIPIYYAWFFYRVINKKSPSNINYLRKMADMVTIFSALVTAVLVVFNVFEISFNSLMKNELIRISSFFILEIFVAFASIKLFFSFKDFYDERKKIVK